MEREKAVRWHEFGSSEIDPTNEQLRSLGRGRERKRERERERKRERKQLGGLGTINCRLGVIIQAGIYRKLLATAHYLSNKPASWFSQLAFRAIEHPTDREGMTRTHTDC